MASGDTLAVFTAAAGRPPSSNYANFNTRNGHLVLEYDAATSWAAVFEGVLPRNYGGGGVTVSVHWHGGTATSGNVIWRGAFEAVSGQDIDSDGFASANSSSADAANGTSGIETVSTIAFTDGAQMDSVAVGGSFRFKLDRDAANGSDTMTGLAQVSRVEIKET